MLVTTQLLSSQSDLSQYKAYSLGSAIIHVINSADPNSGEVELFATLLDNPEVLISLGTQGDSQTSNITLTLSSRGPYVTDAGVKKATSTTLNLTTSLVPRDLSVVYSTSPPQSRSSPPSSSTSRTLSRSKDTSTTPALAASRHLYTSSTRGLLL